ncbi:MAG: hypothetical protein V4502_10400 [Pseudomonadota bacterium]
MRELVLRFVAGLRAALAFAAPVARLAAGLRAVDARLTPAVEALAVVERFAVERFAVERFAVVLRAPVERRAPPVLLRDAPDELARALPDPSSPDHLPLITRCAASATASAMSEPSLVALAIMLLAACDAVSAASRPASRIARRAFGLALIAAAAAARPAPSISLLIAALASLSTVLSLDFEEELEDLFRADFAIASSPSVAGKTLQRPNGSAHETSTGAQREDHFGTRTSFPRIC